MKPALTIILSAICFLAAAQQTIFTVMQGPTRLGDKAFEEKDYHTAIELYKNAVSKDAANIPVLVKLAQSYYFIKDYSQSVRVYETITKQGGNLKLNDMFRYAEAEAAMQNYPSAIVWYKKCLDQDRDNELVAKKIWALSNVQFLLEDSTYYSIKALDKVNTNASELGAALSAGGLVFTSNRKGTRPVDLASREPGGAFYELYIIESTTDSASNDRTFLRKPFRFAKSLGLSYHGGPAAFYDHGKKMILVASSQKAGENGARSLGLYFAELEGSKWKISSAWPYNSENFSITDVTINPEGTVLYFSSDTEGGNGGKDIYTSSFGNDRWSKPVNVGDKINTKGDEVAPYLHRNGTLYFSSNGHPGIGGLDIFKAVIKHNGFGDPENIGYPINSHGDDFGITFDSLATHGYFTSNRVHGGLDDDIYEFKMDLQTYPFPLAGVLQFKEHTWSDSLDIRSWPNIKLTLVDTWQDVHVQETTTADDGSFSFTIPYFSRYHLIATDEKGHEYKASLELEKFRTEGHRYEIVVVKDLFAELNRQKQK